MAAHELTEIFSTGEDGCGVAVVVRWCVRCGAIVVDRDIDGRNDPGAVMSMRRPEVSKPKGPCDQ